jgi:tetratricopeptide (TPR) repeat protein
MISQSLLLRHELVQLLGEAEDSAMFKRCLRSIRERPNVVNSYGWKHISFYQSGIQLIVVDNKVKCFALLGPFVKGFPGNISKFEPYERPIPCDLQFGDFESKAETLLGTATSTYKNLSVSDMSLGANRFYDDEERHHDVSDLLTRNQFLVGDFRLDLFFDYDGKLAFCLFEYVSDETIGRLLKKEQRYDEAITFFKKSLSEQPSLSCHLVLAETYENIGVLHEAETCYLSLLQGGLYMADFTSEERIRDAYASFLSRTNRLVEAVAQYRRLANLQRKNRSCLRVRSEDAIRELYHRMTTKND